MTQNPNKTIRKIHIKISKKKCEIGTAARPGQTALPVQVSSKESALEA